MALARILTTALAFAAATGAQSDDPPPQPASTLLIRLKARGIDLDQASAIVAELKTRHVRYRLQASAVLRKHYLAREKAFGKQRDKVLAAFEKLAKKAQQQLLGRDGGKRVEALRAEALAVTRGDALSKAAIKNEIDPRMQQLAELLQPSFADVLRADDRIDLQLTDLRVAHGELRDWFALYASATEGLELHEDAQRHFQKLPMPTGPGDPGRIDEALRFATFAVLPMSSGDHKALVFNESLRARIPHEEYLGTLELNRIRFLLGLPLLRIDEKLSDAARDHSKDMATLGFFSHTSPVPGKERFGQRAANFGTSASAENIAAGQRTGHGAIRAWWYSPGHHKNMLAGHRRTGLGQHDAMWTQLFGR
ncbi:MAG: CAP domain-containing protein [Planctomycetes bacterium]|nr:CAP domain-containing protein [Planctomycetota bacterium]